jgi:putative ABC transport system ATP-binding protein
VSPERALVECEGLSKTYFTATGDIEALRSVDLELDAGRLTALVGSSGSGKSTLLRALSGLDRPTAGRLLIGGRDLGALSGRSLRHHRREGVTYVAQKPSDNFIPHLTLRQHAEDAPEAALRLLDEFGVADRLDSKPIELSGGEQARAAFALGLARGTPLVVVDEPTAELDRSTAGLLLDAMKRHTEAGVAFVVATHDPDVTATADAVVRLERGQIVAQGSPSAARVGSAAAALDEREVIAAQGVQRSFRRAGETVVAVREADVAIRPGETGVLLGRSGSGKSTLLTLLAGWQSPDAGEIRWEGKPDDPSRLPWGQLAYMPQRFGLLPELSVRENIEYPARLDGSLPSIGDHVDRLLESLGLDELAARLPAETSIGQQQRTALARALVLRPKVLLADEPSSHQDAGFRDRVWEQVAAAAADGTACLIATHEDEAAAYATRLWHMTDGITSVSDTA